MHLATLGWDDYFSRQFESLERGGLVPARIVEQHKNGYIARGEQENGRPKSRDDTCTFWQVLSASLLSATGWPPAASE